MRWILVAITALASSCSPGCATLPSGVGSNDADALAHQMEAWVNKDAWDKTGAIRFDFFGRAQILWDKERGFMHAKSDKDEMWLDLWDRGGFAAHDGVEVTGDEQKKLLDKAYAMFCNDTMWLNPIVKLFDQGTTRAVVPAEGFERKRALRVSYASGGVTPGDSYVWIIDDDGRPIAVRMWVSAIPVKGIQFGWEDWVTTSTGAKIASKHPSPVKAGVVISAIEGGAHAADLGGEAELQRLIDRRAHSHAL